MGAAVGAVIASIVVSKVVSEVAPKLGFSESASQVLGMAAGMYAGGVVGGGSTAASSTQAGATSSQVGANIPAGYGGDASVMNKPMYTEGAATQTGQQAAAGYGGASGEFAGTGVQQAAKIGAGQLQAPVTGQPPVATPVQPGGTVLDSGTPLTEAQAGTPPGGAEKPGMLSQDLGSSAADAFGQPTTTQAGQMAQQSAADKVIESNVVGDITRTEEKSWWNEFFSPEKTMDLAIAGIGGMSDAYMRKEELEYPERIREKEDKEWQKAHGGGGLLTMGRNYASQQ